MSEKLENIQTLIYALSKDERDRLREWFDEFDGDSWDKKFMIDVKEKKISAPASQAKQNFKDGKSKEV
ncbi:MAG: hypothetical protein HYV29_10135 [Ignavibacteriales bacterium]|nr:hypothetical protein [Ignavibacteriales bacterium]